MSNPSQVSHPLSAERVFAQIKQATEVFFRRKLDGAGLEASIPGLEVTDSSWGEWEAAVTGDRAAQESL